jgi:hypothetical protein
LNMKTFFFNFVFIVAYYGHADLGCHFFNVLTIFVFYFLSLLFEP